MTLTATRPKAANSPEPKKSASISSPAAGVTKAHNRGNSFASSTSRIGSTSSRSINGNFSNTMGYSRPASAMSRPNLSISTRKLNGASVPRPATSLDAHAEDGPSVLGKRKGMQIFTSSPSRSFSCPVGNPKAENLKEPKRSFSWNEARQLVPKEAPGRYADLSKRYSRIEDQPTSPEPQEF